MDIIREKIVVSRCWICQPDIYGIPVKCTVDDGKAVRYILGIIKCGYSEIGTSVKNTVFNNKIVRGICRTLDAGGYTV